MENRFDKIKNEDFIIAFNKATNKNDIIKYFELPNNGSSTRYVNKKIKELKLNMNIIKENYFNKYHIKKVCPVCGKEFFVPNYNKDKVCCSYSCSNTYFRTGENNGMYDKATKYSTICFRHHPHKCCICGEENIVAVHHYDGNHDNNDVCNLVPLCPTHHSYWHSNFRELIKDKVDEYVKKFTESFKK